MRDNRGMTDEKRMALLQEYLSSDKSKTSFEQENGLTHSTIYRWLRIFAVDVGQRNAVEEHLKHGSNDAQAREQQQWNLDATVQAFAILHDDGQLQDQNRHGE